MRLVLPLLLLPLFALQAQECLPLGQPVTVQGTIARGPQDRGGQSKTLILMLDKKLCVASQSKKIREMQLVITSEHIRKTAPHMLGDRLLVRGKLHEAAKSDHYETPVFIEVEALIKAP